MSNRRCPKCGEEFSDTYRSCPFCEEENAIRHGRTLRRRGGRRAERRRRGGGAGGVMLLLTGVVILGVVGYVVFGDDVAGAVGIRNTQDPPPATGTEKDPPPVQTPPKSDVPEPPAVQDPEGGQPGGEDGPGEPAEPGPLTLSLTDITIPAGETGRLTASGGSGEIIWTSSNPEIASVDGGAVTGVAGGTVAITAQRGEETAACQVTVEGDPWVDPNPSVYRLSKDDFSLSPSENSWQLKIKRDNGSWEIMGPENGVTWTTSNPAVAAVSETGLVTRAGRGTATVAATVGGTTMECIVRMR